MGRDGTDMKPSKLKVEGETKKEKEFIMNCHNFKPSLQTQHSIAMTLTYTQIYNIIYDGS